MSDISELLQSMVTGDRDRDEPDEPPRCYYDPNHKRRLEKLDDGRWACHRCRADQRWRRDAETGGKAR